MNVPAARVVRPISFKGDLGFKSEPVGVARIVVPVETCGLELPSGIVSLMGSAAPSVAL
jgi:hypothetical protein